MNVAALPSLLGTGLYPLREAARLAQLDTRTARRWAEGYTYGPEGEQRFSRGVLPLSLPPVDGARDLTFTELLTLRLVRGFRETGLSLQTIKRVAAKAASDFGQNAPFVSRRFRTDGSKVFLELQAEPPGGDEPTMSRRERELVEILTGQRAFADVVEPSLFVNVEWVEDLAARWWPLGKDRSVLLDPAVGFGAPRIAHTGVPTATLAAAVRAEGGGEDAAAAVADWYGVTPANVADALRFETEWLARAA
jgi:uncharacterized protein (DUF433 family)/DNA-binding transcriptional MerR regulator